MHVGELIGVKHPHPSQVNSAGENQKQRHKQQVRNAFCQPLHAPSIIADFGLAIYNGSGVKRNTIEIIAVGFVIIGAVGLSLVQTLWYASSVPPGFQYPWVHNFIADYYFYLHVMRQGWEGWWTATSRLTPEVFPSQFVNPLFLGLGQLARIFGLSLPFTYTLARVGGAATLLVLVWGLINLVFPTSRVKRLVALALVVFGTYIWEWTSAGVRVPTLVHQWTELDPLFRLSYIPHHLWSKALMLVAFWLLVSSKVHRRAWLVGLVGLTVLAAGFSSPVVLATLLPTLSLWLAIEIFLWYQTQKTLNLNRWLPVVTALVVGAGVALYHRQLELGVFPWSSYKPWEDAMRYPVSPLTYAQSFGPSLLLFVLSARWLGRSAIGRLLLAWVVSGWLMLFGLGRFIPLSNIRFLGGYQFIPVGIGAAEGLWQLVRFVCRRREACTRVWYWAAAALILVYSSVGFWTSWRELYGYIQQNRNNPQVYVSLAWMEAFRFLDANTPPQSVVLAPYTVGTLIPAFSGNRVVVGHPLMTLKEKEKAAEAEAFYAFSDSGKMRQILENYRVSFVVADAEGRIPQILAQELGLVVIFENSSLVVYKVKE